MLWEAILAGSRLFHTVEGRASYYDNYMQRKQVALWDRPQTIDLAEIERLILFLNQWRSHYDSGTSQRRRLRDAIRQTVPAIEALGSKTLLDVDLEASGVPDQIGAIFDAIASCGSRNEATAASKVLHTIRPGLFVMWDSAIRSGYALDGSGRDYGHRFLPRMQKMAVRARSQCAEARHISPRASERALSQCGHSLAKVLDEYNIAKFTLKLDEVWNLELAGEC